MSQDRSADSLRKRARRFCPRVCHSVVSLLLLWPSVARSQPASLRPPDSAAAAPSAFAAAVAGSQQESAAGSAPAGRPGGEDPSSPDLTLPAVSFGTEEGRACEGCPVRRPLLAIAEVFGINAVYNRAAALTHITDPRVYNISLGSWKKNVTGPVIWDYDSFRVNVFGHAYQASTYFTAGRSLGMNYWESALLSALGNASWEYLGETKTPSTNDLINSALGGPILGEVLYRLGWLLRDTKQAGPMRLLREIGATGIDLSTGINRFAFREATRVTEKPLELRPPTLRADVGVGIVWTGDDKQVTAATGVLYLEFNLEYGRLDAPHGNKPFNAFTLTLRTGGGAPMSVSTMRGHLAARRLGRSSEPRHQLLVTQGFDYENNPAFQISGHSFAAGLADRFALSKRTELSTTALAGVIPIGASDLPASLHAERPYDFGTGAGFFGTATLRHGRVLIGRLSYSVFYLHTLSGTTSDHVVRVLHADGLVHLRKGLGFGVGADRVVKTIQLDGGAKHRWVVPRLRFYLAWFPR